MAEFLPQSTGQTINYLKSEVERLRDQLSRLREETNARISDLVADYEAASSALTGVRAELATSRERHAADAKDLDQLRVTVRDESARAHAAEVEADGLRSLYAAELDRGISLSAEVERLQGENEELATQNAHTQALGRVLKKVSDERNALADALLPYMVAPTEPCAECWPELDRQSRPIEVVPGTFAVRPVHRDNCIRVAAESALRLAGRLPE